MNHEGYYEARSARWPRKLEALRAQFGALDEDDAREDLCFLENEVRLWLSSGGKHGRRWPGRPEMAKRWGWTTKGGALDDRRVRKLLADDDWHSRVAPLTIEKLTSTVSRRPNERAVESCESGAIVASESAQSGERTNADNPAETRESRESGAGVASDKSPSRAFSLKQEKQPYAGAHDPGQRAPPTTDQPPEPVTLPDGRVVPGDLPALLPQLGFREWQGLALNSVPDTRALLRLTPDELRHSRGIAGALARRVLDELARQGIPAGCLAGGGLDAGPLDDPDEAWATAERLVGRVRRGEPFPDPAGDHERRVLAVFREVIPRSMWDGRDGFTKPQMRRAFTEAWARAGPGPPARASPSPLHPPPPTPDPR